MDLVCFSQISKKKACSYLDLTVYLTHISTHATYVLYQHFYYHASKQNPTHPFEAAYNLSSPYKHSSVYVPSNKVVYISHYSAR